MNGKPVDIVLVEDNSSDAELTIRALTKKDLAKYLVHLKNGAEALDYIFARGEYAARDRRKSPRLILLDLKMPKVGGVEVLRQLRLDEAAKKIPVVVFTSSNEDADIDACYAHGANSYVVKPVEFESYITTVVELGMYWLMINQLPYRLHRKESGD